MNERTVTFTPKEVSDWCNTHDDPNPIHTDTEAASESIFGQRVVPGMMVMDKLSGMLTALGDDDETVILSGITAARFRDPILLNETVTISMEIVEEDNRFTAVDFEVRVEERNSLAVNGTLSIVIE